MDSPSQRTITTTTNLAENHNLLPFSPHSNNSSTSSTNNNNNGPIHHTQQLPPLSPTTPKSMPRSESSTITYPTTFVQADSSSFKHVVQMLTGSSDTAKQASAIMSPPITTTTKNNVGLSNNHHHMQQQQQQQPHQSAYKLYQRRNNNLNINPLVPSFPKPYSSSYPYPSPSPSPSPPVLSPSTLDFPSLLLSPVTPLIPDPFIRSGYTLYPNVGSNSSYLDLDAIAVAEEKAIKEKRFFLHPSPSTILRRTEPPRLLPLFPTTPPKTQVPEGAAASSPSS